MRAFAVDTLELSDKFYKAGLGQKVSKVLATEIKTAQENSIDNLVTKDDLKLVEARIKQEIKISMFKAIISMGGMIAIATSFLGWLIKS